MQFVQLYLNNFGQTMKQEDLFIKDKEPYTPQFPAKLVKLPFYIIQEEMQYPIYQNHMLRHEYIYPLNYVQLNQYNEIETYRAYIRKLQEENHHLKMMMMEQSKLQIIVLPSDELYNQVYKMVDYLMNNFYRKPSFEIFQYQKQFPKCMQKKALKFIFFQIFTRYLQATKTREEMMKFIVRKCLKHGNLREIHYNKISNKINTTTIAQLFKCQQFRLRYEEFLNGFQEIAQIENEKKIRKFVQHLTDLIRKDEYSNILDYNRFPWLTEWIKSSYILALQLSRMEFKN